MNRRDVLKSYAVHMTVLTAFVAIALFEPIRELLPMWDFVLAIGFLLAWMLGQRYEREIIVEADLADRGDILEVERRALTWTGWKSESDR